jgi:hypothetical protein
MYSAVCAWHWALPTFPSDWVLSVIGPDRTGRFALDIFVPFILPSRQPTLSLANLNSIFVCSCDTASLVHLRSLTFLHFCLIRISYFLCLLQSESYCVLPCCTRYVQTPYCQIELMSTVPDISCPDIGSPQTQLLMVD